MKICFNIIIREMQINTTKEHHFTPTTIATIKNGKFQVLTIWRCRAIGTFMHCQWECTMAEPLWEMFWHVLKMLNIVIRLPSNFSNAPTLTPIYRLPLSKFGISHSSQENSGKAHMFVIKSDHGLEFSLHSPCEPDICNGHNIHSEYYKSSLFEKTLSNSSSCNLNSTSSLILLL